MQPRFKQLQNSTREYKAQQACWQIPIRRHHISDLRLIKSTGGILYKHLKGSDTLPSVQQWNVTNEIQDNDGRTQIPKSQGPATQPTHLSTTLSSREEPNSQVNSVTRDVSIMSKSKSCNRRTHKQTEKKIGHMLNHDRLEILCLGS